MVHYQVGKNEQCHFKTIGEAIDSVPYNTKATISIAEGCYREKIFCDKKEITFIGAGMEKTILYYDEGAHHNHRDGNPVGTFRSYTAFLGGEFVHVKNMSIKNTAGKSKQVGQAIAVYADAKNVLFENVFISSHQDTLFCAPLPLKERIPGGFNGPRKYTQRELTKQLYRSCRIEGDIDFIFGGGDALFYQCDIISLDSTIERPGFITAPSGSSADMGFVFYQCNFIGQCEKDSVYLGRPWRPYGKTVLMQCMMADHIKEQGFHDWDTPSNQQTCFFAEYNTIDVRKQPVSRVPWAKQLSQEEYEAILHQGLKMKEDLEKMAAP